MSELVVMCPNLIGDTVMATPFLRALRAGYPDARIHAVVKPVVVPVLDGLPLVDEIVRFDPKSKDPQLGMTAVVLHLRSISPDLMVLLPNSFRSALIAWKSGAKARVGYRRGGRGMLLTGGPKPPNRTWQGFRPMPAVDYYLGLAQYLSCPDMGAYLQQETTVADEAAADAFFAKNSHQPAHPLVVFNTGGAFGPAKNWPVEHFAELAAGLLRNIPTMKIVVICGPAEAENARRIVELAADHRVVSLAGGPLGVGLSKAIIRRSRLMVTTDSGPRHFATAFGIPTVSLFGPTHIEWTRTMHPGAVHLQKPVPCGPCQKGTCPYGHHRCMKELIPAKVLDACIELLGRKNVESTPVIELVRSSPRRSRHGMMRS
ncbi:lipopolysaccharide heptosyltransferase II [bacterium]|nr:lipopolysaccharide heptosyltransferase II [bacterium]